MRNATLLLLAAAAAGALLLRPVDAVPKSRFVREIDESKLEEVRKHGHGSWHSRGGARRRTAASRVPARHHVSTHSAVATAPAATKRARRDGATTAGTQLGHVPMF